VRTAGGVAANEWQVEAPGGDPPDAERIVRGLVRLAHGDRAPLAPLERRREATTPPRERSRALLVPNASADATVLEVRAPDRPGLLHELGTAFAASGLSVRSAHVATYAGQTLDTFYLTEVGGDLPSPAKVARTVGLVIDTCDGAAPSPGSGVQG